MAFPSYEGDWNCPNCGDLQFARKVQCRKCGTPRPEGMGKPAMASSPGDWDCPSCGDLQFARNMQCRKCGTPKPGMAGGLTAPTMGGGCGFAPMKAAPAAAGGPNSSIYIDGMPAEMDESQVKITFEAYGVLSAVKRVTQSLWMLTFESMEDAQWLVENLNENIPQGMTTVVKVRFANLTPSQPQAGGVFGGAMGGGFRATPYGGGGGGCMGGKGGGCMGGKGVPFGGVDILTLKRGIMNANMLPGGRWKNDDKTVMVKNLPSNTSDKDAVRPRSLEDVHEHLAVYDLFCPFGAIYAEGVRALLSDDGSCKGTAYVNFLNKESSMAATQTLNGYMMPNGKALSVMLSESVDVRQGATMKGDWVCPSCGDLQFARNKVCRKCQTPNPDPNAGEFVGTFTPGPGDWTCPNCSDLNFARNGSCRKCGTPNPDPNAVAACPTAAGDWSCPNCHDLNFGRNAACRKCGTPNPNPGASQFPAKQGDWHCPSCGDLNFARNAACRKCGTPNPSPTGGVFPQSAGDWNCPACGDLQFARNAACRKCMTPKPF